MNDPERRGSLAGPDSVFTAFASRVLTVPEGQCINKPPVLCGYNISNVSNENIDSKNIKTMIVAHDNVILDECLEQQIWEIRYERPARNQ